MSLGEHTEATRVPWRDWHRQCAWLPELQARLRLVCREIRAALDNAPPGKLRLLSLCAGDGRDVLAALADHPRRADVHAVLLETDAEAISCGRASARPAGLETRTEFVEADAGRTDSYVGRVPAAVVVLSGFLGHLRLEDVARLLESLPMLCAPGGSVVWSRHLRLHDGENAVAAIRARLREHGFEESSFEAASPGGFAVGRARFLGEPRSLRRGVVLFEVVGLPHLEAQARAAEVVSSGARDAGRSAETEELWGWGIEQTLPERFAEAVRAHGGRVAIGAGRWRPTYAELDAAARRLAAVLVEHGGQRGDRAALLMRQDGALFAAMLGALNAGRVVAVLNGGDPEARVAQTLADAAPSVVFTDAAHRALAERLAPQGCAVIELDAEAGVLRATGGDAGTGLFRADASAARGVPGVEPGDLALLIYTSGTTGRPKAVMQTHRNVVFNARRLSRGMGVRPADRVTLLVSTSGGQGVATTWCALLNGATLCPFSAREENLNGLGDWLEAHGLSVLVSPASLFRAFIKTLAPTQQCETVRLLRLGSEAASSEDFAAFQRHFRPECELMLTMSCSETGNLTQLRLTARDRVTAGRLPAGYVAEGVELLVVNEHGEPLDGAGQTGELVARGRYLSPGYWRDAALTARRFRLLESGGERREFRTGDRVRRDPDGLIHFVGREDGRVKIRGHRVELTEIEDALRQLPEVEDAVVAARPKPPSFGANSGASDGSVLSEEAQLVAYVIPRGRGGVAAEALRRALLRRLPGYMVPGLIVAMEAFPLSAHGKVDRAALPPPETVSALRRHTVRRPRDVAERNVARIFESVLGVTPIGRSDDFFELGGTSLQAVEVLAAVEEMFGVALSPSALVERPTVEGLAALLAEQTLQRAGGLLVPLREDGAGRPLFLIHSGQGDVLTYGLMVRQLQPRPVYGLQAPGVRGECWPLMSVPAMAARYLPEIRARQPHGPYLLAGTCMGGMVAFELARRLTTLGQRVAFLGLMDSPTPPFTGRRPIWHEAVLDPLRDALRIARWSPVWLGARVPVGRLAAYRRFVAGMTGLANRRYRPGPFPGTVTLFLTSRTGYPAGDRRELIGRFARETRIVRLAGRRSGLFLPPAVNELAAKFQACLDEADAADSRPPPAAAFH